MICLNEVTTAMNQKIQCCTIPGRCLLELYKRRSADHRDAHISRSLRTPEQYLSGLPRLYPGGKSDVLVAALPMQYHHCRDDEPHYLRSSHIIWGSSSEVDQICARYRSELRDRQKPI